MSTLLAPLVARAPMLLWLTLVWVALWGDPTVGTATAGAVLGAAVLLGASRGRRPRARSTLHLRPLALLRLAAVFAVMLVTSTAAVVRVVLSPRLVLDSAVIAIELPPASAGLVTLVANAVTLTPGTLTLAVDLRPDGTALLHVHALDAADADAVRRDVLRLHALSAAAFNRPQQLDPSAGSSA